MPRPHRAGLMVIWLIGMSGAGKTTIGRALHRDLKRDNPATVFVDGDEIRAVLGAPTDGHTIDGRRRNNERIRALCAWLDGQGIDVVCCILSIFDEALEWNRRTYSDYVEIYVRAPLEALESRQPDDLYGRARRGEISDVVGVDIEFPEPAQPDLVIDNGTEMIDVEVAVRRIRDHLVTRR